MLKLTDLLREESFTAISKDTGRVSVFDSEESRDAAVKAGTHSKKEDDGEKEQPKGEKPNMFSKDAGYDAPDAKSSKPTKSKPKKSKPFSMDMDEKDFESELESDGFSSYVGGAVDGVSTFGDENGNTVSVSAGEEFGVDKPYFVSGFNDEDPANVIGAKGFDTKEEAIAYAKQLGQELQKQYPDKMYEPNSEEPKTAVGLPSQIAKETGVFRVNKGELTPKETTVKDRKFINKIISKRKFNPYKIGHEEYEKRMLSVLHDTLEDSNFHGANRQIFADLQGKPELAKKPDYSKAPKMGTPEREEWDMNNSIYNKNFNGITSEFDGSNDVATTISSQYGWDGEKAIAAILWKMRNDGHGELADKVQTSFDKAMANNESRIKLTNLL